MKIFVLGTSKVGKTTFSFNLSKKLNFQHIQASEWIKQKTKNIKFVDYREEITNLSLKYLKEDQDVCVDYIKNCYDLSKPAIIEGIRNPYDFLSLISFQQDYFIYLNSKYTDSVMLNKFDNGVLIIDQLINYYKSIDLLKEDQFFSIKVEKEKSVYETMQKEANKFYIENETKKLLKNEK